MCVGGLLAYTHSVVRKAEAEKLKLLTQVREPEDEIGAGIQIYSGNNILQPWAARGSITHIGSFAKGSSVTKLVLSTELQKTSAERKLHPVSDTSEWNVRQLSYGEHVLKTQLE